MNVWLISAISKMYRIEVVNDDDGYGDDKCGNGGYSGGSSSVGDGVKNMNGTTRSFGF